MFQLIQKGVNSIKDYKIKTIIRPVNLGGETPQLMFIDMLIKDQNSKLS